VDPLIRERLGEAIDDNLLLHFTWIQARTEGMTVLRAADIVHTVSGLPSDSYNAVCRARFSAESVDRRIAETRAWFAERSLPFAWWVFLGDRPSDLGQRLAERGMGLAERQVAMAADLSQPPRAQRDLSVRRVATPEDLATFAALSAAGHSPTDPTTAEFYRRAAPGLLSAGSPCWFLLGCLGEEPVSALQLTMGPGPTAGCYNLVTHPDHRGRGIARALLTQGLLAARAAGADVAVLQATEGSHDWYRDLRFDTVGLIEEYL